MVGTKSYNYKVKVVAMMVVTVVIMQFNIVNS